VHETTDMFSSFADDGRRDESKSRFALGALKWIYLASALNAGGPSTITELTAGESSFLLKN
jgi:hypothetical protein